MDLGLNDFISIGLSLGTNIIGELKSELKNCKGVVLISPCIIGKGLQVSDILDTTNPTIATCFTAMPNDAEIDTLINNASNSRIEEIKQKIKKEFQDTDPIFRSSMAASQDFTDELKNLEARDIPIAVIFGEEEKLCFNNYLNKVDFKKWKDKTIMVKKAGHLMQNDQPEKLAELIKEFANECFLN